MQRQQFPDTCERCGKQSRATILSKFDTATLCLDCKADERLAPGYAAADAAEVAACRQGNYNFQGVGLSREDHQFLAERRRLRQHAEAKAGPQ